MQRLNQKLADELGRALSELDALKKTVIGSHSLVVQEKTIKNKTEMIEPSFLRVMKAEQLL